MITVVIAFVAALIAMLLTIWDCDFKWVKIFLSVAAISTIGIEQFAGNEIMTAVTDTVEKVYNIGYSEGFAAGEEAMKNLIDKLTSPTISN